MSELGWLPVECERSNILNGLEGVLSEALDWSNSHRSSEMVQYLQKHWNGPFLYT